MGVSNVAESPLADVVDHVLGLDSGPDSPVYTTGYTATLQALGMLGESWSGRSTDWSVLPELAAEVLERPSRSWPTISAAFEAARIIDVVASGASSSSAARGRSCCASRPACSPPATRPTTTCTGPWSPSTPGPPASSSATAGRSGWPQDTSALGCPTLLVTSRTDVSSADGLTVLRLPQAPSPLALAVLQILPIQLLGWSIARRRGLAVDGFRYHQDDTKLA